MDVSLSLSIGNTFVGYGLVETDSLNIIDYGVRLFDDKKLDNLLKRAEFRRLRRQKRRKNQRLLEIKRIINNNFIDLKELKYNLNVYELRKKALNEKVSNEELAYILIHIAKHRGSFKIAETNKTLEEIESEERNDRFLCEIQLENFSKNKKIRGLLNNYSVDEYKRELIKILNTQKINENLKKEILNIIFRKRDILDGPGENSVYFGNSIIKNCVIFKDEKRAAIFSKMYVATYILNELNKIEIGPNNRFLTLDEKQSAINFSIKEGECDLTKIIMHLNINESFSGYSMDKLGNPRKFLFPTFKKINDILNKRGICLSDIDHNNLTNSLIETYDRDLRIKKLSNIINDEKAILELVNVKVELETSIFSFKALNELYSYMLNNNKSVNDFLNDYKNVIFDDSSFSDFKIPYSYTRSFSEALKIVELFKKSYNVKNVFIQSTKSISEQNYFKQINITATNIKKENEYLDSEIKNHGYKALTTKQKRLFKLFLEQNGLCIYSNKKINLNDLLFNDKYEVLNIIPLNRSFNDLLVNKVIEEKNNNLFIKDYSKMNLGNVKRYLLNVSENTYLFSRFLNDDSYETNILKIFIENSYNIKCHTVNKKQIAYFRNKYQIFRDYKYYIYSAIDALIGVAKIKFTENKNVNEFINEIKKVNEVNHFSIDTKRFSVKVNKTANKELSDSMIKSTRLVDGESYVVNKFRNIYQDEGKSLTRMFKTNLDEKLLMYKNDYQTYLKLKNVYDKYKLDESGKEVNNVFKEYYEKTKKMITKYSKRDNGPNVIQVKYLTKKLGTCIDITHKYNTEKRVFLAHPSSFRCDLYKTETGYKTFPVKAYMAKLKNGNFEIDELEYDNLLKEKNLKRENFLLSFYRNDIIYLRDKQNNQVEYKFISSNNEAKSQVELRCIGNNSFEEDKMKEKRIIIAISNQFQEVKKVLVSPIGKRRSIESERLKFKL